MECRTCGVEVEEGQEFCTQCGASLRGVTDPTERIAVPADPAPAGPGPPITELSPPTGLPVKVIEPIEPIEPVAEPVRTAELPAIFDGLDDVKTLPDIREPFRVRFIFIAAFFGAVASLMAAVGDVVDIRTSRPAAGIVTGISTLDDIGTNLGPAGIVGAAVMVVGALLACFGLRWGAGLAGGAGLALAGWSVLTIGLVEVPVGVAESITRTSSEPFTLTVTRDVGWWLIVAVGAIGVVVFLASLRSMRRGGHRALNPFLAAIGAVCALVLATGPLVPVGNATWRSNIESPTAAIDLPTIFFAGRLTEVGLIAATGVVGFLMVRSYGLGLAAGGAGIAAWLWATSLLEAGSSPVGIADRNPGNLDTVPHGVTTVGLISMVVVLLITAIVATVVEITSRPDRSGRPDRSE